MTPAYPRRLADSLVADFQSRGFVVTPDVLSLEEIDRYRAAIDAEVSRRTPASWDWGCGSQHSVQIRWTTVPFCHRPKLILHRKKVP